MKRTFFAVLLRCERTLLRIDRSYRFPASSRPPPTSQTLSFAGSVVNYGTFILTGGASLQASGSFVNDGLLDVMTGAQNSRRTW